MSETVKAGNGTSLLKRSLTYGLMLLFALGLARVFWGVVRSVGHAPPLPEPKVERDLATLPPGSKWSVAVMRNKYLFYKKASPEPEVTPQSPFAIGDAGAGLTAYAIGALVDGSRLNYEDKVRRWLPELSADFEGVTVEELLTHTSGVEGERLPENLAELRATGSGNKFSPLNYFLLERLIAKVSGKSYADFVSEKVLTPLEMANTRFHGEDRGGMGQWWSPAEDLIQLALSFSSNQVVKMRTQARILETLEMPDGSWSSYAQGWSVQPNRRFRELQLFGESEFGNVSVTYYPTRYFWVVILTDQPRAVFDAKQMGRRFSEYYLGSEMRPKPEGFLD